MLRIVASILGSRPSLQQSNNDCDPVWNQNNLNAQYFPACCDEYYLCTQTRVLFKVSRFIVSVAAAQWLTSFPGAWFQLHSDLLHSQVHGFSCTVTYFIPRFMVSAVPIIEIPSSMLLQILAAYTSTHSPQIIVKLGWCAWAHTYMNTCT